MVAARGPQCNAEEHERFVEFLNNAARIVATAQRQVAAGDCPEARKLMQLLCREFAEAFPEVRD